MRILVGKTFGIGNACLAVPMVKALATLGEVDVLVGSTPDDFGALDIFLELKRSAHVKRVFVDSVPTEVLEYDAAVMAIPFDGRWRNGEHFRAREVIDGRKRPGNVDRLGFDMWTKHEVEYQMENARLLGFSGQTPDGSFFLNENKWYDADLVYVGIGYKRDSGGFGFSKHWGNDRYVRMMKRLREIRPSVNFVSTGNLRDLMEVGMPIMREMGGHPAYVCYTEPHLYKSILKISQCCAYVGNDTGMMHIAASIGMPTMGMMAFRDLAVKNPPFCERSRATVFSGDAPSPEDVAQQFHDFVWGDA